MFDVKAVEQRANAMRCDIVRMLTEAGSGHPGGSLSAADIVATLYFGNVLRYDAGNPTWEGRDRFILSKGHAAPVLYAALAQAGYIPQDELMTLRKLHSRLQGHPDMRKLPGVEVSTGSLGQGLSIACGMAMGLRMSGNGDKNVYVLLGDGEVEEGQVWEAAMFASQNKLDNLIAIVDNNDLQIDGHLEEVCSPNDIEGKFKAFNWHAIACDGHDILAIKHAIDAACEYDGGPVVIIAHTIKGKGVSFMEGQCGWHGKAPSAEQCDVALGELCGSVKAKSDDATEVQHV
ncbi:MAG: transketolase [Coriobacteriales bacterium]|jgi:transketolase|nr:transketolase [Coriobacteriales bacterium]